MDFLELNLNITINKVLKELGFLQPTEVQQKAIPVILQGQDVVVRSETGSGKTLAFTLPILQKIDLNDDRIQALVVCPTRELAMQVADETKKIAEHLNVKVCAVFGGSNIDRQVESLKKHPQIVIGTTGRIMDLIKRKALKIENANFVILDEADEMLDMGFRPDIESILSHTKKTRQTLLFSATMPTEVKELASRYLKSPVILEIGAENKALDNIKQSYIYVEKKFKKQALAELFFSDIYEKTIVFVNTKAFADDIQYFLKKNKIEAKAIHGDLRQNERKRILEGFKSGKFCILIATDVAARGLDIKNVQYVVNFDLPHELEFYVHRIGRTARAGASGQVINLITSLEQLSQMRDIEKATKAKIFLYETNSENLKQYFVDTKKLASKKRYIQLPTINQHSNFQNDFGTKAYNQNKFRRFSTFDYFDDFYGEDYKKSTNKKQSKFSKTKLKNSNTKLKNENKKINNFKKTKNSKTNILKKNHTATTKHFVKNKSSKKSNKKR